MTEVPIAPGPPTRVGGRRTSLGRLVGVVVASVGAAVALGCSTSSGADAGGGGTSAPRTVTADQVEPGGEPVAVGACPFHDLGGVRGLAVRVGMTGEVDDCIVDIWVRSALVPGVDPSRLTARTAMTTAAGLDALSVAAGRSIIPTAGLGTGEVAVTVVSSPEPAFVGRSGPGPGAPRPADRLVIAYPHEPRTSTVGSLIAASTSPEIRGLAPLLGTGPPR